MLMTKSSHDNSHNHGHNYSNNLKKLVHNNKMRYKQRFSLSSEASYPFCAYFYVALKNDDNTNMTTKP